VSVNIQNRNGNIEDRKQIMNEWTPCVCDRNPGVFNSPAGKPGA